MTATNSQISAVGFDPKEVVRRIRAALPASETGVALHEPRFFGNEKAYLADCIDTNWVSYSGSYVKRFEDVLARSCGVAHAVSVTSGTVALQIALQSAGVRTGDEVLVPALTFVASANAVVHAGGVPHFVDADVLTLGIDPAALARHLDTIAQVRNGETWNRATGRRIAAILPVHIFGHPADMDAIVAVAAQYGLAVIEDATEALGSRYKDRPCGSLARIAVLSFNGNKVVTTGGGGAILTDDAAVADRLRHLTTTAKLPHRWAFNHDEIGWNFRMPNINAALGLAQMEKLGVVVAAKRRLWKKYREAFAGFSSGRIFIDAPFAESNYWLVALILEPGCEDRLEDVLAATNADGLMTRPAWTPMHRLPMYGSNPRAPLPVTDDLCRRIVNLPSSPFLAPA
jgi:perosamine synthetase